MDLSRVQYAVMAKDKDHEAATRRLLATAPPSRKSLPPFEALRAFDAVIRLKGIRRAAQSIGRDHTVISRHLRSLENWTGVKLVERNAAGVVATEAGRRYHHQIGAAMDQVSLATIELMRQSDHNRLNIWSAAGYALHWLSPRLGGFEKKFPHVELELRPTDMQPDFRRYEADVDIRFVATYADAFQMPDGVSSHALAQVPIVAVASPDYLAKAEPIEKPADLLDQRLLHEDTFEIWANWLVAHGVYDDLDLHGPRLWQGHLTLDAAIHGRGIALTNWVVAGEHLSSGRLTEVGKGNPAFQPATTGIYLLIARADRWNEPLVQRFRSWLARLMLEEFPELAPHISRP